MKEYDKMTVKELIEELDSLGVSFNKKSRKAELLELLLDQTKGKSKKPANKADSEEAAPAAKSSEVPKLSLIHISEPTRRRDSSRMPSSA